MTRSGAASMSARAMGATAAKSLAPRTRRVLPDVGDAAAILRPDLAHRLQHAAVVAPVGRGLNEDEALDPEFFREREKILERRERRRVAQVGLVIGIAPCRAEHVEVSVAARGRRLEIGIPAVR